jgi:hypothetical protein
MPTRTSRTEQAYRERARRIAEKENAAAGRKLSPVELTEAVIKRTLRPASVRQVRAALIFTMTEAAEIEPGRAESLNAAIALLRGWVSRKGAGGAPQTSQWKQKNDVEDDMSRICHAVLATTSENAETLVAALDSGELTGARFVEWPTAKFGPSTVPGYAWELTLVNGKNGNGRSHGEMRTLRWESLPDHLVSQMTFWIAVAKTAAAQGRYETLRDTLEALMRRVTKTLFPRRTKHPTLSSVRHAAAARFKAAYVANANAKEAKLLGLAIVAALLGHASDATATTHYARPSRGDSRFPVPTPDPAEVARIRPRFSAPKHRDDPGPDDTAHHG